MQVWKQVSSGSVHFILPILAKDRPVSRSETVVWREKSSSSDRSELETERGKEVTAS